MEAINRAIEDASDFMELKRKLLEGEQGKFREALMAEATQQAPDSAASQAMKQQKQPGENRKAYRERMRRERKAAAK